MPNPTFLVLTSAMLKVRSRSTGAELAVPDVPGEIPQYGFLTPSGVIFVARDAGGTERVHDWRGTGSPILLGIVQNQLAVAGNYAIWTGWNGRPLGRSACSGAISWRART